MELLTSFIPNQKVFHIYPYEEPVSISTKNTCDICRGEGLIEGVYLCGKCFGTKTISIQKNLDPETRWRVVDEIIQVVKATHKKEGITEVVFRRFQDENLHRVYDNLYKPMGIKTHVGRDITDIYSSKDSLSDLKKGIIPLESKKQRTTSKFNIGDNLYCLSISPMKEVKCPSCGGEKELLTPKKKNEGYYKHVCNTCGGSGEIREENKRFIINKGEITSITLVLAYDDKPTIFYDLLVNKTLDTCYYGNYMEHDLSKYKRTLISRANKQGYMKQVENFYN